MSLAYREHFGGKFLTETGKVIDIVHEEADEQREVFLLVPPDSTVLELGARYGTVSCALSKILSDPSRHVAVEPDPTVINALEENRRANGGGFSIYPGVVSKAPLRVVLSGYGTRTVASLSDPSGSQTTLQELEADHNLKFDVLVADCEGFFPQFVDENYDEMQQFKLILLEEDGAIDWAMHYHMLDVRLRKLGFKLMKSQFNGSVIHSCYYNTRMLPFEILSAPNNVGLFDQYGYYCTNTDSYHMVKPTPPEGVESQSKDFHVSIHTPSTMVVRPTQPLSLTCHLMEPTPGYPIDSFSCLVNDKSIGIVGEQFKISNKMELQPDQVYVLECVVHTNNSNGHAVWKFSPSS